MDTRLPFLLRFNHALEMRARNFDSRTGLFRFLTFLELTGLRIGINNHFTEHRSNFRYRAYP